MADIYYNGIHSDNYDGLLTFSEVPNILTVRQDIVGTYCVITLTVTGSWQAAVTSDTQYSLMLFGETIYNVMSPSNANNKKFYIGGNVTDTAISICRALRNCGAIAADFAITASGGTVTLTSKTIGRKTYTNFYDRTSIPSSYLTLSITDGSADETTSNFINSKIDVDVYANENYLTTLEKNFYGSECAFDVTPVLATLTDSANENKAEIASYELRVNKLASDGGYAQLGTISGYTTNGFLANQSQKYLPCSLQLLNNQKITDSRECINYTYDRTIPFSVVEGLDNTERYSIDTKVYNSSMEVIGSSSTYATVMRGAYVHDLQHTMQMGDYFAGYCVDITIAGTRTMRFYIIKPLKQTSQWQRVLWRNEYGGISFFDFTGAITESDDIDIETYEKNVFDYYTTEEFERKKIYSNKVEKTVKLKSHLMEKNGKWIFNSLMRSKKVWTVINGKTHFIIPKSVEVTEDSTYNDIFTATLTYTYSDLS